MARLDLLGRRVGVVGLTRPRAAGPARRDRCRVRCDCRYGPYGPPTSGPSSQSSPSQRSASSSASIAFLGVALGVGVLDAEDERAAGVAGVGPVEQRGADHADMRSAGRRRAEPHPHGSLADAVIDFPLRTTGLVSVPMPSMVTVTVSPSSMGPTPCRCAGQDEITGQQGHHRRDPLDDGADVVDHQRGPAVLPHLAVDLGAEFQIGRVEIGDDPRPDRAEACRVPWRASTGRRPSADRAPTRRWRSV